ncbi:MAG: DNA gyrase inhibitor YacG [Gammaproteobacteria bacterium]|nr:DNA gyrase inhibitor YacG [Gammaproteobacteria bacterium]
MDQPKTVVSCPTCGRAVTWQPSARWRPFCSERCKLIDLGEWLDEGHRIPGEPATPPGPDNGEPS